MIERQIIIGLITSTEYLRQLHSIWDVSFIASVTAKRLSLWVWEYFEKYNNAPGRQIESIFYDKLKNGKIPKNIAEELEEDILPSLSKEYEQDPVNIDYLLEQTKKYFQERKLTLHKESIEGLLAANQVDEAEKIACEYKPIPEGSTTDIDLSHEIVLERIEKAFETSNQPLFTYPKQLGEFWNSQLVRGGFVALLASEKRGKTFWLMDMAIRACRQKQRVAFFQAGDMSESQLLMRICIYLTKKSNQQKFCGLMYEPVRDCIYNQRNTCDKKERECDFGVFENETEDSLRKEITQSMLIDAYKENPEYKPCYNCESYERKRFGAPWVKEVNVEKPLESKEAKQALSDFFIKNKRSFKLSTHANGTLSVRQIKARLAVWEKEDGFIPDIIIVDYADLLVPENKTEFRHQQNEIWKNLRGLSQEKHCLLITATQADAQAYKADLLKLENFSEDKRKYAHVTAMFGLNQDHHDREKKIGLMRINEMIIRDGEFSNNNTVTVLQNLKRGQPCLGSYW